MESQMTSASSGNPLRHGRIALIGAALVATLSVGRALMPREEAPAPASAPAPTAADGSASQAAPDTEALIAQLRARLAEQPDSAEGWRLLGLATASVGRHDEAARAYAEAARLEPARAEHWSALGEALVLSGAGGVTTDAAEAFRKALERDPRDFRARYFSGVAEAEAGRARAALDLWFALLADAPADAPWLSTVRQQIADLARREGIDVSARLAAAPSPAAPRAGPDAEQVRAAASMSPAEQEAMARSMVDSLAAKLKADPRNPDGWMMLMRSRMMLGDRSGAAQALTEARAAYAGDTAQIRKFEDFHRSLGQR